MFCPRDLTKKGERKTARAKTLKSPDKSLGECLERGQKARPLTTSARVGATDISGEFQRCFGRMPVNF